MPQATEIVEVELIIPERIETESISRDMVVEVVPDDRSFVYRDKRMPRFRGESKVEDIIKWKRRYNLNLQLVGKAKELLV